MRRAPVLVVAAMVTFGGRLAHASPATVRLVGGLDVEACPLRDVRAQVISNLGRDPFADDAPVIVRVETTSTGSTVTARVESGTGDARVITAADCNELTRSIAVAIVLLVESAPPPPPPPAPPPRIEEVAAVPPARATSTNADLLVSGAGALDGDELAAQLVAGARLHRGSMSVALEVAFQPPDTIDVTSTARVTVSTLSLALSPCVHTGAVAFCGVLTTGWTHGTGTGLMDARSTTAPLGAGGIRAEWLHAMSPRVSLRVFTEATALMTTTRYLVDQMPVWTSARYEARAGIGVAAHIP